MHSLRTISILSAILSAAPLSRAALQMTEDATTAPNHSKMKVQILVNGERMKALFLENSDRVPPVGCYVLNLGKDQLYIVSPANHAYAQFDRARISGMTKQTGESLKRTREQEASQGVTHTVENFKFDKVLDEAGPTMFGYPTRHYRYVIGYQDVMRSDKYPKPMTTTMEETDEFWSTKAIGEVSEIVRSLDAQSSGLGSGEGAEKVMEARKVMAQNGLVLKSITTKKDSMSGFGGMMGALAKLGHSRRDAGHTSTREVVELAHVKAPKDAFELPKDYQETDMMSLFTAAASGMPDLNSLPGAPQKQPPAMPDLNSEK